MMDKSRKTDHRLIENWKYYINILTCVYNRLAMVYSGAVWFLKPGFVKELLRVTVPAE